MSKNVVIIPARWGSTRFPGKPLHQIAGKPLLWHVWERCRRARQIAIVTAAHPFENPHHALSPHQVKVVIDRTGNALYFSRAPIPSTKGSGPSLFLRHQGIYGFRREMLLQFVKWKPTPLEQAESL